MKLAASVSGDPDRPAILLLHGWPHSRTLYEDVVDPLGEQFHVLAFDLPAVGESVGAPPSPEKHRLAELILSAAEQLGARSIVICGIDVGGMIAFAAARDYSPRIRGAVIGNTVLPGIDPWERILADPHIWHFAFHAVRDLPELLVAGNERAYFDFFFDVLGSRQCPLSNDARHAFASAYSGHEALKAGFDWYRAFPSDARHNARHQPIDLPILYFRGDADGRKPDPYVEGLRVAGANNVQQYTLQGTAEFSPLEAPERFVEMISRFAVCCSESALT